MKAEIHPKYMLTAVVCGCGNKFETRSTVPSIHVEICSNCHPFYTGKQKFVDTAGRVEKFQKKFGDAYKDPKGTAGAATAPTAPGAAPAAPEKGEKKKTLEANNFKSFAARSKHAPAPVALPMKEKKAEEKTEAKAEKAEAPAAEKKSEPKAEKKAAEPKAEKSAAEPKAEKSAEAPAAAAGEEKKAKAPKKPKGEKKDGEEKAAAK